MFLSGCVPSRPERSSAVADLEWRPNISQPIEQLEEILAKVDAQQDKNYTISNVAFLHDAKLYIIFQEFVRQLAKHERGVEIAEQHAWLKQRTQLVESGSAEYEGGTLASYVAGDIYIDVTKKRIAEIEKRMKATPTKARR